MMKTLTAALVALSLGLGTVSASPAHAEISEKEAVIGLLGLLLLGAAITQNSTDGDTARPERRDPSWRVLPARCLTRINTRHGQVRMFAKRCMNRNYDHVNRLPERCEISVRGARHMRQGYAPRCLHHAGLRIQRIHD